MNFTLTHLALFSILTIALGVTGGCAIARLFRSSVFSYAVLLVAGPLTIYLLTEQIAAAHTEDIDMRISILIGQFVLCAAWLISLGAGAFVAKRED